MAHSVVADLEKDSTVVAERKKGSGARTRNIIISVIFGIGAYSVLVILAMIVGLGGLLIQIPALVIAIFLGRGLYGFLKRPLDNGNGMN